MSALRARSANMRSEGEDAAGGELAGLEVVHRRLHVLERIAGRHELVELEPALPVEIDVAAYVPLWLRRAVATSEHRLVEVHGRDVERRFSGGLGYAEHHAGATPVEQVDGRTNQADVADALEGVVHPRLRQVTHRLGALDEVG